MNGYLQDPTALTTTQNNNTGIAPPPPPPERNSSYMIMQQQKIRSSATKLTFNSNLITNADQQQQQQQQQNLLNNNNNTLGRYGNNLLTTAGPTNSTNTLPSSSSSNSINNNNNNHNINNNPNPNNPAFGSAAYRDNRRVSFHDEDAANAMNNNGGFGITNNGTMGSSYTEAGHLIGSSGEQGELGTIMERPDPDRFIDETMPAMLHTPTTPEAESWNMQIQITPGVIGAQEVYRDPRTRRLAEQQQKQKAEPVPEKLSFKEKMKMFALESGEDNTPKDKLKISRAQRDIDAVH